MERGRAAALFCCLGVLLPACRSDTGLLAKRPSLLVTAVPQERPYESSDDATRTIALGGVPVFAAHRAVFKLDNPEPEALIIESVTVSEQSGGRFELSELGLPGVSTSESWPKRLAPYSSTLLTITYAPLAVGLTDFARVDIASNAENATGGITDALVTGTGLAPLGAPAIELSYGNLVGPRASDCATRFDGNTPVVELDGGGAPVINLCRIPIERALDLGNISLNTLGSAILRIRNRAECPAMYGAGECESCALILDRDSTRENIGVGFASGSNPAGAFTFEGNLPIPYRLLQRSPECDAPGEKRLTLSFLAPPSEGPYQAVVVIESNDPERPVIELPITAYARNAPVALARLSTTGEIRPLERVTFDGSASYDPRDPDDPTLISDYRWRVVEAPAGANPADFAGEGDGSPTFSFWVPLAGHYAVALTVTSDQGIESGDTAASRVEIDAVPKDRVHVQLVWDNPVNDQDLHLTLQSPSPPGVDLVCNIPYDCYFNDRTPTWFAEAAAANPTLDIDNQDGFGPENINIEAPVEGVYRIYVHYYADKGVGSAATVETVRIYLDGIQRAEFRRTLMAEKDIWAVADVVVAADGSATVVPYPSDAENEIGSIGHMQNCTQPGWAFEP